jgi:protein-tyrosine phosphatase
MHREKIQFMIPKRPHGNTYWVEPGRLLAGEYPAEPYGSAATTKLRQYLDAGVDYFVDLTEDGELEPYEALLHAEAAERGKKVEYRRFPIRDGSIPKSPGQMCEILDIIETALRKKATVYVHCLGGIGRTGTVIGCHLTRHGHAGDAALTRLRQLFADMDKARFTRSPENAVQENWVRNWQEPVPPRRSSRHKKRKAAPTT